jgi:hypothetical protein
LSWKKEKITHGAHVVYQANSHFVMGRTKQLILPR